MAKKKVSTSVQAARKKPGGSNVGKYKGVKSFCGPSGGAPAGSYPTDTISRGRSALKLAHNAPNPGGIKACVYGKYPSLKKKMYGGSVHGTFDPNGMGIFNYE